MQVLALAVVLQLTASVTGAVLLDPAAVPPAPLSVAAPPAVQGAPAPARTQDPRDERERAVRALLQDRGQALLSRDREAFLATVSPAAPEFVDRQARLFDALAEVPLASWTYDLDPFRERPADPALDERYGTEWWAPDVQLRYALDGFDAEPTFAPQRPTFVRSGASWLLAADDDFEAAGEPSVRGLWDFGPVVVHRSEHALVLGHPGSRELLPELGAEVDAAVPRIDAVWQQEWSRAVVVLVPDDTTELDRLLGGSTDLTSIAAVATAELVDRSDDGGDSFTPVGDRVIVNPPNFATLGRLGRQVVMTHEVLHVTTRRATGPDTPTWLAEGLADYVGYLDTDVPVETAARALTDAVRAGRVPDALPADFDFLGGDPDITQSYESSWLAFRLLVDTYGLEASMRFYRAVGASRDAGAPAAAETAFATELGTTTQAFTAAWREYLVDTLS